MWSEPLGLSISIISLIREAVTSRMKRAL